MEEDGLKPLKSLFEPAAINKALARLNLSSGSLRAKLLEDHHADIASLALPGHIPEDVRLHFNTARNLLLYSWYVWQFRPIAQLYAYASLELALRLRALSERAVKNNSRAGLSALFKLALNRRWIDISQLTEYKLIDANQKASLERWSAIFEQTELALNWAPQVNPEKYAATLSRYIPFSRNKLAHGSTYTPANPIGTLLTCRDIIAQLFPPPSPERHQG